MEDKKREHVEAVPGPAIIISKEEYERMKEKQKSEKELSDLYKEFFERIRTSAEEKNSADTEEIIRSADDELTLG